MCCMYDFSEPASFRNVTEVARLPKACAKQWGNSQFLCNAVLTPVWSGLEGRQGPLAPTAEICEGRREGFVLREDFPLERLGAVSRRERGCLCAYSAIRFREMLHYSSVGQQWLLVFKKKKPGGISCLMASQLASPANHSAPQVFLPSHLAYIQPDSQLIRAHCRLMLWLLLVNTCLFSCLGAAKHKKMTEKRQDAGCMVERGKEKATSCANNRSGAVIEMNMKAQLSLSLKLCGFICIAASTCQV